MPVSYLKAFGDEKGFLWVYRKDNPKKKIHQSPDNFGFHKYYYSIPRPNNERDNNCLENLFSKLEDKWPILVDRLCQKDEIKGPENLGLLLDFIALQRARVPATRDAMETARGGQVKAVLRSMDAAGRLPPRPKGYEHILNLDQIDVAIDPYQSLLYLESIIEGVYRLLNKVGLSIFHNKTEIPFLTSDNPVVWFDPLVSESDMKPYSWRPEGSVLLLFPLTPNCIIYGERSLREQFESSGVVHVDLTNPDFVTKMNRQICRFAYEAIFAQKRGQESLIEEFSDVSPVLKTTRVPAKRGEFIVTSYVFGARKQKLKFRVR